LSVLTLSFPRWRIVAPMQKPDSYKRKAIIFVRL
jgi:hypothetical protein